jgi:hypothetical protein
MSVFELYKSVALAKHPIFKLFQNRSLLELKTNTLEAEDLESLTIVPSLDRGKLEHLVQDLRNPESLSASFERAGIPITFTNHSLDLAENLAQRQSVFFPVLCHYVALAWACDAPPENAIFQRLISTMHAIRGPKQRSTFSFCFCLVVQKAFSTAIIQHYVSDLAFLTLLGDSANLSPVVYPFVISCCSS